MTSLRIATARLFDLLAAEADVPVDAGVVVAPGTVEEAAMVIGHAADVGMSVGFVGGGTHLGYGGPISTDVAILTTRLDRIVDHQPDDLTIVVEGGVAVADLRRVLSAHRQMAVLPERPGVATVGGTIAAGVSGYRRLRYGPTRDRLLQVTMATGYGQVVTAGGRVVKNVTGYDLSRLAVGSLGSLGMIGRVCLKLWPEPRHTATVEVDDAAAARELVYRPLAVLETPQGGLVHLGGTDREVEAQAGSLGGRRRDGLHWPDSPHGAVRLSLRVPPRLVAEAVRRLREIWAGSVSFVAQHGIGVIEAALDEVQPDAVVELRRWAEDRGGAVVLVDGAPDLYRRVGAWGTPPASLAIQRRVKAAFDPANVLNPGKLPGGI